MAISQELIIITSMEYRERIFKLLEVATCDVLDLCSNDCVGRRIAKK